MKTYICLNLVLLYLNCVRTQEQCGGTLNGNKGDLQTPFFGTWLPENAKCVWIIQPKQLSLIQINFEAFQFGPAHNGSCDKNCSVHVEHKTDKNVWATTGYYCGDHVEPITRKTDTLRITATCVKQPNIRYAGFEATYRTSECDKNISLGVESPEYIVSSPFFPKTIGLQISCSWTIEAPNGYVIDTEIITYIPGNSRDFNSSVIFFSINETNSVFYTELFWRFPSTKITSKPSKMKIDYSILKDSPLGFIARVKICKPE